jgi:4-hydroxy-tetrahydrodipicolinate reductase
MGQRILSLASEDKGLKIALALEYAAHPGLGQSTFGVPVTGDKERVKGLGGLIDFSTIDGMLEHVDACLRHKVPMVIGITGLSGDHINVLRRASKKIPIVFSPNMSIGVNLVFALVREAASRLPKDYLVSMTEAHHVHKKDAPSGTAKHLAQIVRAARAQASIDIKSIREGEIIGDHEVVFDSPWDTIKISHSAKTRDIFAKGALEALKFVARKKKGLFAMSDVLKELKR